MNEESQHRKILSFLDKRSNKDIDNFCIFQWIERCHFQGWWDLAVELGGYLPPYSLDQHYEKRLDYLLKECRDRLNERPKSVSYVERVGRTTYVRPNVTSRPPDRDLTGTLVRGFRLEGVEYRADSHKDVFMQIVQIVFKRYPEKKEKVLILRGTKRRYFSRDKRDLSNQHELIPGTQIWVELQQNANTLYMLSKELLKLFGMDDRSFEIMTAGVFRRPNE